MTTQTFPLGTVLTVTTGRLFCDMDEVYRIHEFLAGEPVWTHQLPRVSQEALPSVLAQHPQLADVEVPETFEGETFEEKRANIEAWLDSQIEIYGNAFKLEPLVAEDHTPIDPISEIRMMRPDMPVIALAPNEDGSFDVLEI